MAEKLTQKKVEAIPDEQEPLATPILDHTPTWPELDRVAYYGLAGDIVNTIKPHTESDPVGILVQLLTMFGNAMNRTPYFPVEADRHYMNLFVCLVGATGKGRKGTGAGHPRRLLTEIDAHWGKRIMGGLSSGEGVIWHVRDAVLGENKKGEAICLDPGVDDKRLCILETEFARGLAKTAQDGNVLSAVLRQAWDHGDLRTLVSGRQKSPVSATHAHVSVIGHITVQEVQRLLNETEAANGFGNRFLWVCTKRAQLLPRGGKYPAQELAWLKNKLDEALRNASRIGEMARTEDAQARWETIYTALADGPPGLLGAMTARAEAQVLRLSCLYALLDSTSEVAVPHLNAAYALWRYCEASARYIFGDVLGDPLADDLHRLLRQAGPAGMTRTDFYDAFAHHQKSAVIGQALLRLQREGLALSVPKPTSGRPEERWYACVYVDPAQKAQKAQKAEEVVDTSRNTQSSESCTLSAKSAKSPPPTAEGSALFELNALNARTDGDGAITPANTEDDPSLDPLFELNALFVQGVHTHTATAHDGQVLCVDCGEVLEEAAPPAQGREVLDL